MSKEYEEPPSIAQMIGVNTNLAKRLRQLRAALDKHRWIPVEERLPEVDTYVLWAYESGGISWDDIPHDADDAWLGRFLSGYHNSGRITHWRPIILPEGE